MTATSTDDWEISHHSGSAPNLYRATESCELHASVAHSGHWVAVGVSSGSSIGVDIQLQDKRQRTRAMADLLRLQGRAAIDQQYFFSCWTLREAIAKATNGSVLTPHVIEAELAAACTERGRFVSAGSFSAMVDVTRTNAHFAIVLVDNSPAFSCA